MHDSWIILSAREKVGANCEKTKTGGGVGGEGIIARKNTSFKSVGSSILANSGFHNWTRNVFSTHKIDFVVFIPARRDDPKTNRKKKIISYLDTKERLFKQAD